MTTSLRAPALALLFLVPSTCKAVEPYPGQNQMVKLGRSLADQLGTTRRGTIVIASAGDQNLRPTPLGRLLEPDFVFAFKGARAEEVVLLSSVKAILSQHKLEATGLVDPEDMSKLGKILPARVLINIVVEPLGGAFIVRAVASDMKTAALLAGDSVHLPQSDVLVSRLSAKERRALEPRAQPQDKSASSKILYELVGCKRKSRMVKCELDLTSLGSDQRVRLQRRDTYAIDSQGKPHEADRFNTGKKIGWKLLLKGIPSHVEIEFDNIPKDVKHFRQLKLGGKDLDAKFSEVRISG